MRGLRPGHARPRRRRLRRGPMRCRERPITSLRRGRRACDVAFITNNASRPPEHGGGAPDRARRAGEGRGRGDLGAGGLPAAARAARGRARRWLCWAGPGSRWRCGRRAWSRCAVDDSGAQALVTGYGPDVLWRDVMRAAVRVRDGLSWVASNTDYTIPTAYGVAPGHGMLVQSLSAFSGVAAGGGRQAGPTAARRDRPAGGRRAPADGGRPAGHRHRGRHERRASTRCWC